MSLSHWHAIRISVVQQLMILEASSLLLISIKFITYLNGIVYLNAVGTLSSLLLLLKIRQSLTCVKAFGGKSPFPLMVYFECREVVYTRHLYVRIYNTQDIFFTDAVWLFSLVMMTIKLLLLVESLRAFWVMKDDVVALGSANLSTKSVI